MSSSTGKSTKLGSRYGVPLRGDLLLRFMESKMAPSPRLVWDLANRENFVGESMTPGRVAFGMLPLNLQGGYEAGAQEGAPFGVTAGLLGSVGFGVNTYPDKSSGSRSGGRRSSPVPPPRRRSSPSPPSPPSLSP